MVKEIKKNISFVDIKNYLSLINDQESEGSCLTKVDFEPENDENWCKK